MSYHGYHYHYHDCQVFTPDGLGVSSTWLLMTLKRLPNNQELCWGCTCHGQAVRTSKTLRQNLMDSSGQETQSSSQVAMQNLRELGPKRMACASKRLKKSFRAPHQKFGWHRRWMRSIVCSMWHACLPPKGIVAHVCSISIIATQEAPWSPSWRLHLVKSLKRRHVCWPNVNTIPGDGKGWTARHQTGFKTASTGNVCKGWVFIRIGVSPNHHPYCIWTIIILYNNLC